MADGKSAAPERTAPQGAEREAFLYSILGSSTPYPIIAKDLDGTILAWNKGARRNHGYSAEGVVGKQNVALSHLP